MEEKHSNGKQNPTAEILYDIMTHNLWVCPSVKPSTVQVSKIKPGFD